MSMALLLVWLIRPCGMRWTLFLLSMKNIIAGEKKKLVGEMVPYGRMGKPQDLVGAAIFLASNESDYVVAQTYNVDGGNWMS